MQRHALGRGIAVGVFLLAVGMIGSSAGAADWRSMITIAERKRDEQGKTQVPWVYYSNLQHNGAPFPSSVDDREKP